MLDYDRLTDIPTLCDICREVISDGSYTHCTGCCGHQHVSLAMDLMDPARELTDQGICDDCGADVHLEHDEDRVLWEAD